MNTNEDYKLIPMSEITDEARELAVAWMECEDKHWIEQKHKLASDIMNYAIKYHAQSAPVVSDEEIGKRFECYANSKCYMEGARWYRDRIASTQGKGKDK